MLVEIVVNHLHGTHINCSAKLTILYSTWFKVLFSSLQHLDIAALLIKYNTSVNAVDRWGFTPLHEASQKGRTQLCALLVRSLPYFIAN